jgi:hypothetical protein
MKLINGPTVNDALVDPENELTKLVNSQADDRQLIEEVFLRFLSRRPSAEEMELGLTTLQAAQEDERLVRQRLSEYTAELAKRFPAWEAGLPRPAVWTALNSLQLQSVAGATFAQDSTGAVTASGVLAADTYQAVGTVALQQVTGVRLEALPDAALPAGGPGRAPNGNFVVNELQLFVQPADGATEPVAVALQNAEASFSQDGWAVQGAIDGRDDSGWAIMPQFNRTQTATFHTSEPLVLAPGLTLMFRIVQHFQDGQHALGKFRLSVTDSTGPFSGPRLPDEINAIVATPSQLRSAEQQDHLRNYFYDQDPEYQALIHAVQTAASQARQHRLTGVQDLAWALINTPAFLFNR